ncbi:MAG: 50S ribosomal protein L25, partial [Ktedonobacteraceae bacterium]
RTAFDELRRGHVATGVIAMKVAGTRQAETALIRHVQHEPRSGKVLHIDFFRVSMRDRITAKIPLQLNGVAPGVKIEGGILLHLVDTLEVECTASEIVESVELDISGMENIGDMIHAKDVPLPPNYTLITDAEEAVVKITPPRIEKAEEVAEAPTEAEAAPAEAPAASAESKG